MVTFKRPQQSRVALPRVIGLGGSFAIMVGTVIGSGIFLVPHNVALQVHSAPAMMAVWGLGGLLTLAGALSLAELGAAMPHTGGVYVYLREAYGRLPAFLYGWGMLLVIQSGSIATLAVAFGIYSGQFVPLTPTEQKMISGGVIALLTLVNVLGTRQGSIVQSVFTWAKLAGLGLIIAAPLFSHHAAIPEALNAPPAAFSIRAFGVALIGVLWSYEGWHMLSYTAGEVKDPACTLPRSYLLGALAVMGVYCGANLAYLRILSPALIAQHQRVASFALRVALGPHGASFVTVLILCSIFGALNGSTLTGARAYFAMAQDGMFFRFAGRVHGRFRTPAGALILQGGWTTLLAVSGSYEQLFTYVIFSGWLFYAAAVLAVIVLRRRQPQLERPFKVRGYPLMPVAFTAAALLILANTLSERPRESLLGLALILTGIPIYWAWIRSGRRKTVGGAAP